MMPPTNLLPASEAEDRLDREIASLWHTVENEAHSQDVHEEGGHAQSDSWPFRIFAALRERSPDRIAHQTVPPLRRSAIVLRRARYLVRRHGSVVAFSGLCTGVALAVGWLVILITEP